MSKVIHTCTGCVPIDKSIIDVYIALLSADKSVTEAETARVEAENARIAAETARDLAESSRKSAEDARETTSSADHATAIEDHAVAEADHTTAETDHDTASSDHTSSVEATEAADTATARANAAAAAAEHMVDIKQGPKGDQGNTGSSIDYPYELVNNVTTDDATKGLSAAQGVVLDGKISQLGQEVSGKVTASPGTNLIDPSLFEVGKAIGSSGNVGTNADLSLSGYIPVNGQDIISNAWANSYWPMAVYDADFNLLRTNADMQYTYQSGDAYVRMNFLNSNASPCANYGTTLAAYEPFNSIGGYLGTIPADVAALEIQSPCFTKVISGSETNAEKNMLKAVRAIHLSGPIPKTENLAVRAVTRAYVGEGYLITIQIVDNSGASISTGGAGVGYYDFRLPADYLDNGLSTISVEEAHGLGITLRAIIDYSLIPMGGQINRFGQTYRWWIKSEDIEIIEPDNATAELPFDVAVGSIDSKGGYAGELDASPIVNDATIDYVGYKATERSPRQELNEMVVAINHDDFPGSDLIANRKIYNKFGMAANFNFILTPFTNKAGETASIANVKKMVKDGDGIGLHAILGKSYWWMNKQFDLRPDGSATFAPTISDLQGSNADHTGTNAFGTTISATTKASDAGYNDIPSSVENAVIVSLTSAQLNAINRCYSIYGDTAYTITGRDLDGNSVTKTPLGWLEYWYNNLIDDSLGYSSTDTSAATKFAADYDDATKYPDATHLANGKMVHYQDTTNPNYSDASYQKVGKFTAGLFKGCFSACNWEVIDRCIEVATAFIRHYYGIAGFTNLGRHGVGFFSKYWTDSNGYHYDNAAMTLLLGEGGLFYASRVGKWMCEYDILEKEGILMTSHQHPLGVEYWGQYGLYKGQKEIQGGKFNVCSGWFGMTDYLNFFGTNASESTMTYANFKTFLEGLDDWLKFAYENSNQSVTRNGLTYNVFQHLKFMMDIVRTCAGTGKIAAFSLDTIKVNPAISTALDLFLRFCYRMGVKVVPMEVARQIANNPDTRRNYFANPMFKQSILQMFGGSSTALDAYLPDGWTTGGLGADTTFTIEDATISGQTRRAMTIATTGNTVLRQYIWGVPGGSYKLKFYGKASGTSANMKVFLLKNGNGFYTNGTSVATLTPGASWELIEQDIVIPQPKRNAVTTADAKNQICRGYEDNVCCVRIELKCENGILAIADPSIVQVF